MSFGFQKYLVTAVIGALVVVGSIASAPRGESAAGFVPVQGERLGDGLMQGGAAPGSVAEPGYTNLKVLPKDISSKKLQRIMIDEFEDGLGVGCNFCHAEQKGAHRLDYASDARPEKEIARNMMRMTMKLNRNYFKVRHPMIGDSLLVVSCSSCHHGQPRPEGE